jgi:hypothetical protein
MICRLDPIRDHLIDWSRTLWLDDTGAFRNGSAPDPHLPSSLFMSYILYSCDGLDSDIDRERWTQWIRAQQDERDGTFSFPPPIGSSIPRKGIALWNAKRTLGMLGSDLAHFPEYQREAMSIDGLQDWFRGWESLGDSHHEVLALAPTVASHPDPDWRDAYFSELALQQHPNLGYWPGGDKPPNISRTFAYTLVHLGMNRLPPQPERIIDTMIDLQDADGLWHGGRGFSTMDAVYLLLRLPESTGWCKDDACISLNKTADRLVPYFDDLGGQDRSDTHPFAAPVQTLALLSEALPDRFETSHQWRFAWERSEFWVSDTIKSGLEIDI